LCIFNMQSRIADKGWPFSLGIRREVTIFHPQKLTLNDFLMQISRVGDVKWMYSAQGRDCGRTSLSKVMNFRVA
jgi:hypothetical protein